MDDEINNQDDIAKKTSVIKIKVILDDGFDIIPIRHIKSMPAHDKELPVAPEAINKQTNKPSPKPKPRKRGKRHWRHILLGLLLIVIVIGSTASIRNQLLNLIGLRSNVSIQVLDKTTNLPINGVLISISGQRDKTTNLSGAIDISNQKLGGYLVKLSKPGYSAVIFRYGLNYINIHNYNN